MSAAPRHNNLPSPLTTFIGREREMEALARLVDTSRLITLTGSGGCGKTRLALEVAASLLNEFPDGVWWVDLAAVSDPDVVASSVAAATGIREAPGEPVIEVLAGVLVARRILIVLDNCEHLIAACAELSQALLGRCEQLVILATSREPLGIDGETTWRVPSLAVADEAAPAESLAQSEAVRLFTDRAAHARPTFRVTGDDVHTVAKICRRLDGIPLAIELAAARIRVLTLDQISAGLDDRFRLLAGGRRSAISRQRTLEASVDWSYDLLEDEERILFRRLSVFAGSFALQSAETVGSGEAVEAHRVFDLILQLVDRSLVQAHEDGSRYRLLETMRQYGWQKAMEAGEADALRSRHLEHFAELAERASPQLELGATLEWLERLDFELDNWRAALDWASTSGSAESGLKLAGACSPYWDLRGGLVVEARARLEDLLAQAHPDAELRAKALVALELMALDCSDVEAAIDYGEQARELARDIQSATLEARALTYRGGMMALADPRSAVAPLSEGLERARECGDAYCTHWAGQFLGAVYQQLGDISGALGILDDTVANARASGDLSNLSGALYWRGLCHLTSGRLANAERDFREGCELTAALKDFSGRMFYAVLGFTLGLRGDHEAGRGLIADALRDVRETRNVFTLACGMTCLAFLERAAGDLDAAAAAAEEATEVWQAMGLRGWLAPHALALLAWAEMRRDNVQRSVDLLKDGLQAAAGPPAAAWVLVTQGLVARHSGDPAKAEDLARRCLAEVGPDSIVAPDALELLAGALADLGVHADAARIMGSAHALRTRQNLRRWAADEADYRADFCLVQEALGDEAFTRAWEEGAALSAENAIAFATRGRGKRGRPPSGWESLTPTELQVVRLVTRGLTNTEIGQHLFITSGTAKTHLAHVFAKLGVATRAELATEATRRGL